MAVYQSPMPIPAYRAKRKAGCISETASYGTNNQRLRNHILLWKIPLLRERNGRFYASVSAPYMGLCTALHLPPRGRPTSTAALVATGDNDRTSARRRLCHGFIRCIGLSYLGPRSNSRPIGRNEREAAIGHICGE